MIMKTETILKLLNLTTEEKMNGIFLSDEGELYIGYLNKPDNFTGELKEWWSNGQLSEHSYYKNGKLHGEYKSWSLGGTLVRYELWKNGKLIKDYLEF